MTRNWRDVRAELELDEEAVARAVQILHPDAHERELVEDALQATAERKWDAVCAVVLSDEVYRLRDEILMNNLDEGR